MAGPDARLRADPPTSHVDETTLGILCSLMGNYVGLTLSNQQFSYDVPCKWIQLVAIKL